jgi:hypothetical protein
MTCLRSVAGYTRKDQIKNKKIEEEIIIFNLSNNIQNSRSHWKYHALQMEERRIPRTIFTT